MADSQLPQVAKSFSTFCKKCNEERYHTVLTHTTETSAKVQCENCKAKSTYKLGAPRKAAAPKATGPRKVAGAALARSEAKKTAAANHHKSEFDSLMAKSGETAKYSMKVKFATNQKLQHPKFGPGVVRNSFSDKIEVVFQDEVRQLVHNRAE
jgi:hypothetical protein